MRKNPVIDSIETFEKRKLINDIVRSFDFECTSLFENIQNFCKFKPNLNTELTISKLKLLKTQMEDYFSDIEVHLETIGRILEEIEK